MNWKNIKVRHRLKNIIVWIEKKLRFVQAPAARVIWIEKIFRFVTVDRLELCLKKINWMNWKNI